jgi:type IV pilus assembly protein PilC
VLLTSPQALDKVTAMENFQYRAIDQAGKQVKGYMNARSITDLEARLHRMGLDLMIVKLTKRTGFNLIKHKVSHRDLVLLCFQLEQLLTAGVPILEGLNDLTEATDNAAFKKVLAAVSASVEGGKTLSQAFAAHADIFDAVFIHMVGAGEQTGELSTVFNHLCQTLKWQDALFAQLKRLLTYPLFIFIVVMAAVGFLMIFLVPQLIKFMGTVGQAPPWNTKLLVFISAAFVHYWWLMIALPTVVISLLAVWMNRSEAARYTVDRIKLSLPILGEILNKMIMARFARYFALLYRTGIPILTAIKTCEDIVGNRVIARALHGIHDSIHAGNSMSESFKEAGLFPSLVIRMISVGEQSGGLDQALMHVSYFYDRDVEERLQKMLTMLEPTLTVTLGLILLFIMAAVLGPVYETFSQMPL